MRETNAPTLGDYAYANAYGYTDVTPYRIVRIISDTNIQVQEMKTAIADGWKPAMEAGGFAGHCTNNEAQRWTYEDDPTAPVIRIRKNKNGQWTYKGTRFLLATKPEKYYDYNF